MKLALFSPPNEGQTVRKGESLGLRYISSVATEAGWDVLLMDAHCWSVSANNALDIIFEYKPDVIGIQLIFSEQIQVAKRFCEVISRRLPHTEIVVGGHVVTFSTKEVFDLIPEVSIAFIGESELTFKDYLEKKESQKNVARNELHGISYISDSEIATASHPGLVSNLDSLGFPERKAEDYLEHKHASVLTSRGCTFKCSFCSVPKFFKLGKGSQWRLRSVKNIIDEIRNLVEMHGITHISFVDDIFLSTDKRSVRRVREFSDALVKNDITIHYSIECRAEAIERTLFSELKKSGLKRVLVGFESGNEDSLLALNKKTTTEVNYNALSVLRELDIDVAAGFIMFEPDSTLIGIKDNVQFLYRCFLLSKRSILSRLIPYPGTPEWRKLSGSGRLFGNALSPEYKFSDESVSVLWVYLNDNLSVFHEIDVNFLRLEFEKTFVKQKMIDIQYSDMKKEYSLKLYELLSATIDCIEAGRSLSGLSNKYARLYKTYQQKSMDLLNHCLSIKVGNVGLAG